MKKIIISFFICSRKKCKELKEQYNPVEKKYSKG